MGGMDNKTSIDMTKNRRRGGIINAIKSGKKYEEYLAHPSAQYRMTFLEYKKNRHKMDRE
jgi:hypothetical protein